jgi:prepilin-type N-terminal cleavage/methylation domain-containing protein
MIGQTKERKSHMNNKGFTLIEMLVVITIIAILSAVLLVGFSGFVSHAKDMRAEQTIREIRLDLFLLTSETPYEAVVDTKTYLVSYDFDDDTFVVAADGSTPTYALIVSALELLLEDALDLSVFDVNATESTTKERIDLFTVGDTGPIVIEYDATNGGGYDWEPTVIPRSTS